MAKVRVVVIEKNQRIDPTYEADELAGLDIDLISVAVDSEGEVIEAISGADVVLNSSLPMPPSVIETLTNCKLIVRLGHGYEGVDLDASTDAGIIVCNAAGATSEEVSNHALSLMLYLARRLYELNPGTRAGRWGELWSREACSQIWGETIGIFGLGHIGRTFARKVNALRMNVIAHDPYVGHWADLEENVRMVEFDELVESSDFISIHAPYNSETHNQFNADVFRRMKPSAYLVNTGRGGIVSEADLVAALKAKEIAGAAIDVFETEPQGDDNPLFEFDNVIVTPHVAGSSPGGWERIRRSAARDAARVLTGRRPYCVVNTSVLAKGTRAGIGV
ncbi:MAG: C-terminal binding protein [Chloroflexi bacterium]|nr:C-terminal binding protein [Chloroflexota bacterium]